MTSGRTSKLIRELDRTLVFGEYISSKRSNDLIYPMVFASLKFKSGHLLDELLQRKPNAKTQQVLIQARGVMKWGAECRRRIYETDHAV